MVFRSGFAAVVGRPNVGKSTLVNALIGRKVAITSPKPQTTRDRISGIRTDEHCQVIFLDTPGIHKPRHLLGESMVKTAIDTLSGVDLTIFVVEANREPGKGDLYVAQTLGTLQSPVLLAANKVDLERNGQGAVRQRYEDLMRPGWDFATVSAREGSGVSALLGRVKAVMPPGPLYYPEGYITDRPERFVLQEIVREKVLLLCQEEVPHSVAVVVDEVTRRPGGITYVAATVYVERESQKRIVIGESGRMLREIGRLARRDIEDTLDSRVYLETWVKVKKGWRNREAFLRSLGYGGL